MSEQNPPGFLQNVATHTAEEFRNWLSLMLGGSISGTSLVAAGGVNKGLGNKLSVTQAGSPNMTVLVKSGAAAIPGTESTKQGCYFVLNDADVTVTIAASDPTLPRIDLIVYKVQDTQYSGAVNSSSIVAVTGTPAGSPSAPAAPNNSLILAQVAVAAATTSIVNANITDRRTFLSAAISSPNVQIFTTTTSWTKPAGARYVKSECVGAGGGGGGAGAAASGQHANGGGGGGGTYTMRFQSAELLGSSESITIGAGGTAGANTGTAGGTGGTSSFGTHHGAVGGSGGTGMTSNAASFGISGGSQGSTSTGTPDLTISGTAGAFAYGDAALGASGAGGNSGMGFGGGGLGRASGAAAQSLSGIVGGNYGGGASGGLSTSTGAGAAGGVGGPGIVIVTTYFG